MLKSLFNQKNIAKTFIVLTIILFLLFLIIYFTISNKNEKKPTILTTPSPTPYPIVFKNEGSHLLNWIKNMNSPVNGFSFSNGNLIYSNPNGFYEGYTNTLLQKEKIVKIIWTAKGQSISFNGTSWKYFDFTKGKIDSRQIFINGSNPVFSPDGKYVIDSYTNKVDLINTDTNKSISKTFSSNVEGVYFSPDSSFSVIVSSDSKNSTVYFLDNNLNQTDKINLELNTKILGVTADKKIIINKDNILTLVDSQKSLQLYSLQPNSEVSLYNLNDDFQNFILWEKITDELNRKIDYLWKINTTGSKDFIISSKAVIKRFDQNIPPLLNKDKDILLTSENKGVLWMTSLVNNLYPSYTDKGFVLSRLNFSDKGI